MTLYVLNTTSHGDKTGTPGPQTHISLHGEVMAGSHVECEGLGTDVVKEGFQEEGVPEGVPKEQHEQSLAGPAGDRREGGCP